MKYAVNYVGCYFVCSRDLTPGVRSFCVYLWGISSAQETAVFAYSQPSDCKVNKLSIFKHLVYDYIICICTHFEPLILYCILYPFKKGIAKVVTRLWALTLCRRSFIDYVEVCQYTGHAIVQKLSK